MIHIDINNDRCIGCKFCAMICPKMVLHTAGGYVATVIDVNRCNLCMACEKECPESAIEVREIDIRTGG
ncbi:ferredoxin family protein [Chloroflexota bacterium]